MADIFTKKKRSEIMRSIKGKWTKPEKAIHNSLKGMHVRHEMHPNVPGSPDILVTPKRPGKMLAVWIDGCFWHCCLFHFRAPKTRKSFWKKKIEDNIGRDIRNLDEAHDAGYSVLRIWEHDIREFGPKEVSRMIMREAAIGED